MKCPYCGSEMKEGNNPVSLWEELRGKRELLTDDV